MKKMLNTLYITSENKYLSLNGECVAIKADNKKEVSVPLTSIDSIICYNWTGVSPSLIEKCAIYNIPISYMSPYGKFLGRFSGKVSGNVLLRKMQYQIADSQESISIASNMILGKTYNARWVIERFRRDHPMQVDMEKLGNVSGYIKNTLPVIQKCHDKDTLRGMEGKIASEYFSVFNDMILRQKESFIFSERNRRPPLDNVNAMLSLAYSLLTNMAVAALEGVGLDPCVGFLHGLRPGRYSLALDIMEELRPVFADRFVLKLINKQIMTKHEFVKKEDDTVLLTDEGRRKFFSEWQNRKKEEITHPFLNEKIEWGMVPHIQAMLLARYLRGDLEEYPPFLWK